MMLDFALNDPSTIDESASKQAELCTDAANPGDWLTAVAQRDADPEGRFDADAKKQEIGALEQENPDRRS